MTEELDKEKIKQIIWEVLKIEGEAVLGLREKINEAVYEAVEEILSCKGKVVITGIGKSGAVGRKIASTFASTGTPSVFLHPAEAMHGELGLLSSDDIIILISYNGETEELINIIPFLKRLGIKLIALTGNPNSSIAKASDIVIDVSVEREACPFGIAPTSSTTATMAMGDALAIAIMSLRRITRDDLARLHPGGTIGRRLLLKVEDVMRTGKRHAVVEEETPVRDVLFTITKARGGAASVVDKENKLVGIITDGDIRRHLILDETVLNKPAREIMTETPITIQRGKLAAEALRLMQERNIDDLPVVDEEGHALGMIDIVDLVKVGIV
ncbi:KpsF/GutQ family sugar-phosphate isomerase [bacterium]|nr:KpsF/GutQ family sugar-phosphate isomerase [bacterium]